MDIGKAGGKGLTKAEERRRELHDIVIHPKAPPMFCTVMDAVEKWKGDIRVYQAAGGRAPEDEQKRQILSRMIPENDKEKLYDLPAKHKTYESLWESLMKKA